MSLLFFVPVSINEFQLLSQAMSVPALCRIVSFRMSTTALSTLCIPMAGILTIFQRIQLLYLSKIGSRTTLPRTAPRKYTQARTEMRNYGGINALIEACNSNDRFKLLEDNTVPQSNLTNLIHPALGSFIQSKDSNYRQAFQFASQLLSHDALLSFFVPLLYGRELETQVDGSKISFLSDPLANVSDAKRREYLSGVREGLQCIGHRTQIEFVSPVHRVYARTTRTATRSTHTSTCCTRFQKAYSPLIEIADYFKKFYEDGYKNASRCAQFRHDFLFATTLVHELIHAFGVLRRGDLDEPHIRADDPNHEWGWAWENFMFGCIINPQKKIGPGTHLLMRKVWAEDGVAEVAGGKEYCDVPMAWIAQWFREETWAIVAEQGPTAIAPPTTHFKIQSSNKLSAWIISSDDEDIKKELRALHNQWKAQSDTPPRRTATALTRAPSPAALASFAPRIIWRLQTMENLQKSSIPVPVREPRRVHTCIRCGRLRPKIGCRMGPSIQQRLQDTSEAIITKEPIVECSSVCSCRPLYNFGISRTETPAKRSADPSEEAGPRAKRNRP